MEKAVVSSTAEIFEQGNLHMANKLQHFGEQGQAVIKYVISRLRKYRGTFFESNATIAENVGCSLRTVQYTLKRAEQLEIFVVSTRYESTFNGKMRQTTNKIQLLAYEAVEVVKEVVEVVRKVATKVADKAKAVKRAVSEKGKVRKAKGRHEVLPEWFKKPYVEPDITVEDDAEIEAERKKLAEELRRITCRE